MFMVYTIVLMVVGFVSDSNNGNMPKCMACIMGDNVSCGQVVNAPFNPNGGTPATKPSDKKTVDPKLKDRTKNNCCSEKY